MFSIRLNVYSLSLPLMLYLGRSQTLTGRPAPYQLLVSARTEGELLLLQVSDNGRGITPERLLELGNRPVQSENKGSGVALHQLLQSLRLIFGESVELSFDSIVGQGTVALLKQAKRSEL